MEHKNRLSWIKNSYIKYILILIIGVFLGWMIFGGGEAPHTHEHTAEGGGDAEVKTVWSCSMHPQIKQDKPGKCPICGMDLTPQKSNGATDEVFDENAIQLSNQAMALAKVTTSVVSRKQPIKRISLYGTVKADERNTQTQTAHVGGRVEKLYINFVGETVQKGQTIAKLYSPELLSAQQELIEAKKLSDVQPMLLEATREKLRLWKLTDDQIDAIERSGQIQKEIDIKATTSGVVIEKAINEGDYVSQGSPLFKVANLRQVWVLFDAFEGDLPFLKLGDIITFTIQALPHQQFEGKISFIDPMINKTSRTARVRVETKNPTLTLKPEMYASATIEAKLKKSGEDMVVPKSAVLWTGKRSIVYVKEPNTEANVFMLREVELGNSLGDSYVVLSGLKDGEEIVTNGTFMVDASAQLEGKVSMMNNDEASHNAHARHTMDMSKFTEKRFRVGGACGMCKERIEKTALSVNGVAMASWDKENGKLTIHYDDKKTSEKAVAKEVARVGHDNDFYKAEDAVYDALPGCCKYRK